MRRKASPAQILIGLTIFIAVVAVTCYSTKDCGLTGDPAKCTSSPFTIDRVRTNEYFCKLDEFRRACGSYPTTEQGLNALVQPLNTFASCQNPSAVSIINAKGVPRDGYGNPFVYTSDGRGFSIRSLGKDGKPGGTGDNFDNGLDVPSPPTSLFGGKVLFWGGFNLCF